MTDLVLLSSKAPAARLARMCVRLSRQGTATIRPSAAGGVTVEQRINEGERVDIVVLAQAAIGRLTSRGRLLAGTEAVLLTSSTVLAVTGDSRAELPGDIESLLRLTTGSRVGISTGPSGGSIRSLFEHEGVAPEFVVAPPGVPVAQLIRDGACDLGFQQETEFEGEPGIRVLGPLPAGYEIQTDFVGAVAAASAAPDLARSVLADLRHDALQEGYTA